MKSKKKRRAHSRSKQSAPGRIFICEAEVLAGLKPFAQAELMSRFGQKFICIPNARPDQLWFQYRGKLEDLLQLRQVVAIYLVEHFAIPRPRALLGHQNLRTLLTCIKAILGLYPANRFHTFRFSAAGKNSSVFARIKDEIQQQTTLEYAPEEADLFLRIRPAQLKQRGWEVLTRISPRPLSVRSWRVCDMPGALNATVAAAMIELSQPKADDRFLNLMCGSGTLLIERLIRRPARVALGGDLWPQALLKAKRNIGAANLERHVQLVNLDAASCPLPGDSFNVICADLPWGQLVGSRAQNADLYPKVLLEAARLATSHARFVLLSHAIKLLDRLLKIHPDPRELKETIQLYQGGLHPKVYLLRNW